jgi:molybdate-binding protein/DNA-binding XRE family transcriptional regulator
MPPPIENRLQSIRTSRGISAAGLAGRVGVSRQSIYAIEAGTYIPNTELSLKLARALEVTVESIFSLPREAPAHSTALPADLLSAAPVADGAPARICDVGPRRVAIPATPFPYFLPEADGLITSSTRSTAEVVVASPADADLRRLVLAGCDPAIGLVARMAEKQGGIDICPAHASSKLALHWLREGKVHIAGTHLKDAATGEFNLPYLRREFPGEDLLVVNFARWEEGILTAPGNPKRIRKAAHLAHKKVSIANREPGAGARALLDRLLANEGIEPAELRGYDRIAAGHLSAAWLVATGEVDACIATRSAAAFFQLDFVPLQSERYDLVLHRATAESSAIQVFLDFLQRATLRRRLELVAGYDTSQTGANLA